MSGKNGETATSEPPVNHSSARGAVAHSLLFLVAFALSGVMLLTDKNLQTDFGAISNGYYSHWYVVLVMAIADLIGAILLLVLRSRFALKAGVAGSGLLALIFLGDIFTYSQVGFSSAGSFANYLFGVTYYGGNIRFLYDALLAVYLLTAVVGGVMLKLTKPKRGSSGAATSSPPPMGS